MAERRFSRASGCERQPARDASYSLSRIQAGSGGSTTASHDSHGLRSMLNSRLRRSRIPQASNKLALAEDAEKAEHQLRLKKLVLGEASPLQKGLFTSDVLLDGLLHLSPAWSDRCLPGVRVGKDTSGDRERP